MSAFKVKPAEVMPGMSKEKAMGYAQRAEGLMTAPDQAMVYALLALFWLKAAELEAARVP
jgi:hypothetical protein